MVVWLDFGQVKGGVRINLAFVFYKLNLILLAS
jgi:hypothetical protein